MGYDVAGKRILLTGASSGIGRALALELAPRAARLALVARREDRLESVADEVVARGGARPLVLVGDLARQGEAAALAERVLAELGVVDVLVNNAGGGVGGTQWRVSDSDEAREAFEVNFWSPVALTATLVPRMRERGDGAVVNVTSAAQVMPVWQMGHYAASKAALALATDTLALELRGSGVHVLQVIPGPTDTAVQAETKLIPVAERMLAEAPVGDPAELARLIVGALARGRRRLVYPRVLRPVYEVPALARINNAIAARRFRAQIDMDDPRVVRTGSMGDDEARAARDRWDAER